MSNNYKENCTPIDYDVIINNSEYTSLIEKSKNSTQYNFVPPVIGDSKYFRVYTNYLLHYEEKQATLRATGNYGNIWVIDDSITTQKAKLLSDTFD